MGKKRNAAVIKNPEHLAAGGHSTSLKEKKSIKGNLKVKQNVKFKTQSADASGSHGSSKKGSRKFKKGKLQKDLVIRALRDKSPNGEASEHVKKQIQILSAKTVSKMNAGQRHKAKHKKKGKQAGISTYTSYGTNDSPVKKLVKNINEVPLAVEMPKVIDASDDTISDLNSSSDIDITLDMDNSDGADSSPAVPLIVTDCHTSNPKKSEATNVPLAVVMPGSTSRPLTTQKARKEKVSLREEILTEEVEDDTPGDSGQVSMEVEQSNRNSENLVKHVDGSRRLSEKDQVLEKVKVHLVGSSIVLQLTHSTKLFLFGQVELQVLYGKIKILGYEMDKSSSSHLVSSLRGSSFLSVQTLRHRLSTKSELDLPPGLQDEAALRSLISASDSDKVWILLKEGNQEFLEYILTYLEFPISLKELKSDEITPLSQAQEALGCLFQPERNLGKRMTELSSWEPIAEAITKERNSCTVLCGGKGVGKSTLLRFLVNRILSSGEGSARGVVVLDFDPGQGELTPPGCVAVSLVKKPLLGPNYTHLQQPERCVYIGEISVTQCLGRYIEASASIIEFFRKSPHLSNLPCIINTMGFTQGIGVTIMGQLLKLLQPNRVVQIESRRRNDNYPFHLESHAVIAHSESSDSRCIRESLQHLSPVRGKRKLHYSFVLLQSAAEAQSSKDENAWGMPPRVSRNAVILSYFSPLINPPSYSLLDDVPFSCPLGTLFLCVAHEQVPPNFILAAINGNMVALCTIDPTTTDVLCHPDPDMPRVLSKVPIAPCIGFGIVRGVDMQAKMLYLSTPLTCENLSSVNCLIYGIVNLPTTVNIKSTAPGLVPYVSSGHHPALLPQ